MKTAYAPFQHRNIRGFLSLEASKVIAQSCGQLSPSKEAIGPVLEGLLNQGDSKLRIIKAPHEDQFRVLVCLTNERAYDSIFLQRLIDEKREIMYGH